MKRVYFDHAATTPMLPQVIEVIHHLMVENYGNPSSTHAFGRETKGVVELSRKKIADLLKVHPSEIIFTSCGTESNNLIIRSCVMHSGVERIISSTLEHKCVRSTVLEMQAHGTQVDYVSFDEMGNINLDHLEELLQQEAGKTLVTLMHANNELGNLTDISKVGEMCDQYGAFFHSDTVQTIGHYPLDLYDSKVHFASCSAHKIHGPKGIGFAFIKKNMGSKAMITGGGQERGLRSGTENVYGIAGMAKALEMAYQDMEVHQKHIQDLKSYTLQFLKEKIADIHFNGTCLDSEQNLYTVLNICLPFKDPMIGFELDLHGIAISQGSACSSGANQISEIVAQVLPTEYLDKVTPVRISFSAMNTKEEVDYLVEVLEKIAAKQPHSIIT